MGLVRQYILLKPKMHQVVLPHVFMPIPLSITFVDVVRRKLQWCHRMFSGIYVSTEATNFYDSVTVHIKHQNPLVLRASVNWVSTTRYRRLDLNYIHVVVFIAH